MIYIYDRYTPYDKSLSVEDFRPSEEPSFPTNRVLDLDVEDSWADQEWEQTGIMDNQPAIAYYLFDEDEIENKDPEDYPWDIAHISRIIINRE